MTNKIKNRRLHIRCGFLSITYRDESKIEQIKIKNNKKEIRKNKKIKNKIEQIKIKNNKKEIRKNKKIKNKIEQIKIKNNKKEIRKNNKKKTHSNQIQKMLNMIEKIVLIGCALSGLLSSLKYSVTNKAISKIS